MESGIYILAGTLATECNLPKVGEFRADGSGPLFSRAAGNACQVLFEGILTANRETGLTDAEIALRSYEAKGLSGLRDLEGFFRLALIDLEKKRALVVSDPMAVRPLYLYRAGCTAAVAPTPWFFRECGLPMSLDRQGLYQSFRFYHPVGNRTLVEQITRSRPLTVYEIHADGTVDEHAPNRIAKEADDSIDLDIAASRIKEIMAQVLGSILDHPLLRGRSIVLPLTAGQDSRHILGELIERKRTPEMLRHVRIKQCDYEPVRMIAEDLSIPLDAPAVAELDHPALARHWIRQTAGLVNFHQSHLTATVQNLPDDALIGFDGYLCDHFLGLYRRPGTPSTRNYCPFFSRALFPDHADLSDRCESEVEGELGVFVGPEDFRVRMFDAFNRGVHYTGAAFPVMGDRVLFFAPGAHRLALDFCRLVPEPVAALKRARLRMFHRYFPHLSSFPSEHGPPFSGIEVQPCQKPSRLSAIGKFARGMLTLYRTDPAPETCHEWLRAVPFLKRMHLLVTSESALARDRHLPSHVAPLLFKLHQAGASFGFALMTLASAEVAYRSLVMRESTESILDWLTG
jgi:hypothetical protein